MVRFPRVTYLLGILLALSGQSIAEAARVTANSTTPALKRFDSGSASWIFSTPTFADTIEWYTGVNETDGVFYRRRFQGLERKFNTTVSPPTGRPFRGFRNIDGPGPNGSVSLTSGVGTSTAIPGTVWGTNYSASWTIFAVGRLGGIPIPSWTSTAEGDDPYSLTTEQFSDLGITGPSYDLFFAAGLSGGNYSQQGSIGLDVFYDTASGTANLLSIAINNDGVTVTNDNPSGLSIYLLDTITEGPTQIPENLTSLSSIQAILEADVAMDRRLNTPLYLGFVWDDIPVPTVDLGDGSVAKIRIESNAVDSAQGSSQTVPEPTSTLSLLALGTLGAASTLKLKRNQKLTEKETTKAG